LTLPVLTYTELSNSKDKYNDTLELSQVLLQLRAAHTDFEMNIVYYYLFRNNSLRCRCVDEDVTAVYCTQL